MINKNKDTKGITNWTECDDIEQQTDCKQNSMIQKKIIANDKVSPV